MKAQVLRQKFLAFFAEKGHQVLPNISLIPENDPTTLFISAGMHPLVPYLLGQSHPLGQRLCSLQKCLRTDDIESVGDTSHHTFFEMLGNWSLGDPASPDGVGKGGYWKRESIGWSFEFLTSQLKLNPERLYISCFGEDKDASRDSESAKIWQKLGIPKKRIYFYGKKENWWGPAGKVGPCGPDTEIFYDVSGKPCSLACHPNDNCGRFFEIWNDVFMEYNKTAQGKYEPLKQKNVDTGMGVERTVAVLAGLEDNYESELFLPIIRIIEEVSGQSYKDKENKKPMRIIADHVRAATFLIADGVVPGKVEQGYVLRKLIRRAIDQARTLGYINHFRPIISAVIGIYRQGYPELGQQEGKIYEAFGNEESQYVQTIQRARKILTKVTPVTKKISGEEAFNLYATHGLSPHKLREQGYEFDQAEFEKAFVKHQEISRKGAEKKFTGGLADQSEETTKLHTATHLLHQALRTILGPAVRQAGSNITPQRLRFDFTYLQKLTPEQIKKVEDLVNQKIRENLPVKMEVKTLNEALAAGALAFFKEKYGGKVKVYKIGNFSQEVCGGPHVYFTGTLKSFKILKEESAGAGIRRIYAVLQNGSAQNF